VLLSALSNTDKQKEGYLAKADAYLDKPFQIDILLLIIKNLLLKQVERKEYYKSSVEILPDEFLDNTLDQDFLNRVLMLLESNLQDSTYSVERLSMDMHMDRTGLFRKIKALTGLSPSAFIRSVKLKKAKQLLIQGLAVADVADKVGFGTVSYFSKCFQEEFGCRPSLMNRK